MALCPLFRMNLTAEQRDALGAGSDALENLLDDWEIAEDEQANATLLRHILVIRDLLTASKPAAVGGQGDAQCIDTACQWWDAGVPGIYGPGCGIIPRESRRL